MGGNEDVNHIVKVAQDIVGTSAHKNATAPICRLTNGVALKLKQTFLRQIVDIEIIIADKRKVVIEDSTIRGRRTCN